jgi:hypothetical protein
MCSCDDCKILILIPPNNDYVVDLTLCEYLAHSTRLHAQGGVCVCEVNYTRAHKTEKCALPQARFAALLLGCGAEARFGSTWRNMTSMPTAKRANTGPPSRKASTPMSALSFAFMQSAGRVQKRESNLSPGATWGTAVQWCCTLPSQET